MILTLVAGREAATLTAAIIGQVRDATKAGPPEWLAPGEAAEFALPSAPDPAAIAAALEGAAVDWFSLPAEGRRKSLLVADMDATIVIGETLDELAAEAGIGAKIAAITARAMNGELDFKEALRARVAMLKGLELSALERTWKRMRLSPGARTLVATMRAHGAHAVLVSGGFGYFVDRVAALCGFDESHANQLIIAGDQLAGTVAEPILDRDAKLVTLERAAARCQVGLAAALTIGDGANDLAMLRAAGLGIAYHAKPVVAAEARARIDHADLRAALFAQGYPQSAFHDS